MSKHHEDGPDLDVVGMMDVSFSRHDSSSFLSEHQVPHRAMYSNGNRKIQTISTKCQYSPMHSTRCNS